MMFFLFFSTFYGPRQPDAFEGAKGNDTFSTATPLNLGDPNAPTPAEMQGWIKPFQPDFPVAM